MPPFALLALLLLVPALATAAPAGPRPGLEAERGPSVTGRVFDAYLDVRIALRQQAPDLDARVAAAEDPTPLARQLAPFLSRYDLALEHFVQAHRLVARDLGLKGRVAAILDRHTPTSGAAEAPPPGGAVRPPTGSPRPSGPDRRR